jgi:hypothetical protein
MSCAPTRRRNELPGFSQQAHVEADAGIGDGIGILDDIQGRRDYAPLPQGHGEPDGILLGRLYSAAEPSYLYRPMKCFWRAGGNFASSFTNSACSFAEYV